MRKPIDRMTVLPFGEDYMIPAWFGLFRYSILDESEQLLFKKDTGIDIKDIIGSRGVEAMIDEATSRTKEAIVHFADWLTVNRWGEK